MSNLYNDKSIESLSPRDFTRLRPGVYCGSTEYSTQLLIEIVSSKDCVGFLRIDPEIKIKKLGEK